MAQPIRLGVVGGMRGRGFGQSLNSLRGEIVLAAICDINAQVRESWLQDYPSIRPFADYDEMLDSGVVDAVLIATPMFVHAEQAVKALERNIHVASEVTACVTREEAEALIRAVKASRAVYFYAENYCYSRTHMMVEQLARTGAFGDITYVRGAYYHDCLGLMFYDDGSLTWRGRIRRDFNTHTYPTHTLGPIDRWLGVREGRDAFESLTARAGKSSILGEYARARFGPNHEAARPGYFKHGDAVHVAIKTQNGVLIDVMYAPLSPQPGLCASHHLMGTKGAFETHRPVGTADGVVSASDVVCIVDDINDHHHKWTPILELADRYEHPLWREFLSDAQTAGHGGGDFFTLRAFAHAIRTGEPPDIDVYDAVNWTQIIWLADESIRNGGAPVNIPDIRKIHS